MKKCCLIFLVLVCNNVIHAQLKWLNPKPAGWINTKIHFTSNSTGYLMNYNGELFVTNDTGNTWQEHGHYTGARTFKIQQSTGIMPCLDSNIYLSTDNGVTWLKSINIPGGLLINEWCDIVGSDTLFVLKYGNPAIPALCRSVDKGASWQIINNDINQFYNTSIDFITSRRGYALKPGGIFRTIDGGVSWQEVYNVTSSANVITMKFYDSLRGLAYRESHGMLRTIDGGTTWTLSNQVTDDINDIFYADALNAYACGDDGVVFKTTDGGINWTAVFPSGRIDAYDLYTQYFFNANDGIVAGHRGRVLRTRNGGAAWQWLAPTYIDMTGISFGNENTGYATTWNNIYKSTDSGNTWSPLALTTTGLNSRFEHLRFSSRDTGIATTNFPPRVHKTTNGGSLWTPAGFTNPLFDYISSISFFSKDTGFASVRGSLNALFKTYDGGSSWNEVGSFQDFNLLFFFNDQVGYATRYNRIYRTTNGGLNWTELGFPAIQPFKSMWFINPSKGFTVGDQGQMKMTMNEGATWTDLVLDPFALPDYSAIRFYDQRIGYATDDEGRYYKTIDSGYHWKQNGVTPYECRSLLFRPDTTVVFAGVYGTIASRDIAEYKIDSVRVIPGACSAEFRAKISSFLSAVDSIWFQYGKNAYTSTLNASPISVLDNSLQVTSMVNNLQADSVYHFRVKIRFKGRYYYSEDFVFKAKKATAPVITAVGNVLSSSVPTGNQWYLNGTIIAGATSQQYTATVSGNYTVTATQAGCPTLTSAPFSLVVTSIPDITAWGNEIMIFPNPVTQNEVHIIINNNRKLILTINDLGGRKLKEQALRNGPNLVSIPALQAGTYLFVIVDTKTSETVQRKVVKF